MDQRRLFSKNILQELTWMCVIISNLNFIYFFEILQHFSNFLF